jgi:hypothetical protein
VIHQLLPTCGNGTFILEGLDLKNNKSMHMQKPYTYHINISTDLPSFCTSNRTTQAIGLFFRLVLCNALAILLCSPWNLVSENSETIIADSAKVIEVTVERIHILVTPWIYERGAFVATPTTLSITDLELQFKIPFDAQLGSYQSILHTMLVVYYNYLINEANATNITSVSVL